MIPTDARAVGRPSLSSKHRSVVVHHESFGIRRVSSTILGPQASMRQALQPRCFTGTVESVPAFILCRIRGSGCRSALTDVAYTIGRE